MADNESIKNQHMLLSLLVHNKSLIEDFNESPLRADCFDPELRILVHAINNAYDHGVKLTRKTYLDFCGSYLKTKQEVATQEMVFNRVSMQNADVNDYPLLKKKIHESHLTGLSSRFLREFSNDKDEKGIVFAIKHLGGKMADLGDGSSEKKVVYENILEFRDDYWADLTAIRDGTKEEDEFIGWGLPELDKTTTVGAAPGTLTLFCGDVGGFKSTMMLNVAMNVWQKSKKDVLYIPLEMPRHFILNKMLSRQSQIDFDRVASPKSLTEEEYEKLRKILFEDWNEEPGKFFVMDSYEQRARVSMLRREISRNIDIVQPSLVVVDYIANLEADSNRQGRNDLEIGDMLKDLRHMGRPGVVHAKGFAIVSGAQIGRDALKRVRKGGGDKTQFFSEDLRGSHEYSADADNIYVLFRDPQQPDERLQIHAVKCRYGKTTFPDGGSKAILEVKPACSLIKSSQDFYSGENIGDILQKVDDVDMDISINSLEEPKGESKAEEVEIDIDSIW